MGMFGNAMGAMVGAGGGGNAGPMNRRPGMPVQGQNPGQVGQNQNAMSGARTAQMRNPMNPGMMGPSQGMQNKMMPQAGLPYGQSNQMGQGGMMGGGMGQSYQPNGPKPTGGFMPPPMNQNMPGNRNYGINGGNPQVRASMDQMYDRMNQMKGQMGRGFVGGPPMQGNDVGAGGGYAPMQNQGPQPMPMNNGEAPEEVPGAEEQMNPQMQNLMSQYGGRGPMNSPMSDPRMKNARAGNFGTPGMLRGY